MNQSLAKLISPKLSGFELDWLKKLVCKRLPRFIIFQIFIDRMNQQLEKSDTSVILLIDVCFNKNDSKHCNKTLFCLLSFLLHKMLHKKQAASID